MKSKNTKEQMKQNRNRLTDERTKRWWQEGRVRESCEVGEGD